MAIVRIDFSNNQLTGLERKIASVVHDAMTQILSVPQNENYIVCERHEDGMLLHDPQHVARDRLSKIVFIQITLNQGRSEELKKRFFSLLTERLAAETGTAKENVFINLIEVASENWSFGRK
jgi:4-oxalocrotonate tautomerase